MDISELDAEYKKKSDIIEKEFLKNFKLKDKSAESNYKKYSKETREWYYKEIKKIMKRRKEEKKKNYEKEVFKRFKLNKTKKEIKLIKKIKRLIEIFIFRYSIKIKNHFDWAYYPSIAYFFKKIRCEARSKYKAIKIRVIRLKKITFNKIRKKIEYIKNGIISIYQSLIKMIKKDKKNNNKAVNSDQNKDKPAQN